ncbi:hypothetical protein ACIU0H_14115 [Pseudomonas aeruginosa]
MFRQLTVFAWVELERAVDLCLSTFFRQAGSATTVRVLSSAGREGVFKSGGVFAALATLHDFDPINWFLIRKTIFFELQVQFIHLSLAALIQLSWHRSEGPESWLARALERTASVMTGEFSSYDLNFQKIFD